MTYQADLAPVAPQLAKLAAAWRKLKLSNGPMPQFARAVPAEFQATLDAAPFDNCSFVTAIAAHNYSYAWAKISPQGAEASQWWDQISNAGDRTTPFWELV